MRQTTINRIEGPAFSCILSVPTALALTKPDIDPQKGIIYWLLFVVASGLSIDPKGFSLPKLMVYCTLPSCALVLTLIFRGALSLMANGTAAMLVPIASCGGCNSSEINIALLYVSIFVFTPAALVVACLSRGVLHGFVHFIWTVKERDLASLEKKIIIGIRIASLVLAVVLAVR